MKIIESKTSEQTLLFGEHMGKKISKEICLGVSIALNGELGAGKTTFVQGFAKGLGVSEKYYITSPTYNIINEYPAGALTLCHLDLYRLESVVELETIGFDDLVDDSHIIVVEWPKILKRISFKFDIEINFKFDEHYNRILSVVASGQPGSNLLSKLFL
ncbi:MAG: tRNA (adenosine(37)-N6)-threonylcarbamoyltransferase complex ATPase subunit type 1 TsaE [Desulfobacula sp.]|jgi:tRNA threonylcarbamoyladenosine biosynthesis protein TsaE|uniref:tRNA (adenosine(37)-N6)-threonylcarbamoyltransferase complex ATPase subunit type 1 TsaE n=1 Tax=Desulfobacula sp. TaxID=2593537 RepID=UPI001D58D01C|nr:tRNA (adenosine(37)-N6)-threonylcarbamoyltransferase complex ATPase subunit type 1 TsaE [Desulfobacula sp.]MBT3484860.1 tRNA (adenosine(37)-N6)-threonylcarbamoyltransferase complex ATPase subunit type 1 TsaE [Desulfobacula sp.]MBT3804670.1 tRNA (adenosine(37)-N6)-threonylcarbamoyltransferase complex ATPase subunit type 1 TsaE [Desulfobacula sp.]MBT4024020.1 tRNA (adenosine(37)-N6)-threonylcarbamoyltransferase complex ATPase subunit type 1 TsaE [Desulfobacula sp.]MBT4198382.1 tRNA (adenosine(